MLHFTLTFATASHTHKNKVRSTKYKEHNSLALCYHSNSCYKPAVPNTSDEGLVRGIRRWDLVAVTINGIIGAGIFGLPAKVYALIGTYSLIAFVACALVVAIIILCFAEVSSRFDETGGPYLYAREAYGPTTAFQIGWLIWLARLTAFAANCNLMINYLGYFWAGATTPFWRAVVIIATVVALMTINLLGIRQAANVSNVFTIGKLLPMLIFIAAGLFFLNPQAYTFGPSPSTHAFSQSVLLLIYAFTGFEMAVIPAGETRDPQRDLPRALLIALGVVATFYIFIQIVCVGTLPELAQSQKPLADAGMRFLGVAGGALISAGAIISIIGNLNILVLSGSRIPFAMAEQKQLPTLLGKVHPKTFVPYVAIIVTSAVMLFMTLKSSFVAALTISAIARLITYAATAISLPVFRHRVQAPAALFNLPAGPLFAAIAVILIAWLLLNSTLQEAKMSALAIVVGFAIYFGYRLLAGTKKDTM
ncbi:MAG: APC family permease [Blastocatellia bacterium]|nr:MAG: APC family permease [Blastocatellia bacterium]